MPVTIRLIGFGDDKPPGFDAIGRRSIATESTLTIDRLLQLAGIEPAPDLIVMNTDSVIPRPEVVSKVAVKAREALERKGKPE